MPNRDSVHDYRPDPTFEIVSHLSTRVTNSRDDSAIPQSARKAEGVLDDYHLAFCTRELDHPDVQDLIPRPPEYPAEGWVTLSGEGRRSVIRALPWADLVTIAKTFLDDKPAPDFSKLVEHRAMRPYLEALLWRCPDYFAIKDYFHDGKAIHVWDGHRQVSMKPRENLKAVMGGFVAFRNFYVNGMLKVLRDDGPKKLNFTHKMVGSVELNSDYDITVGGVDDVAAAHEFHRAFRLHWKVESAQLFDTNLYYRDWLIVKDQPMPPSVTLGKDPSIQVQVLDFIGDIYGLVKIRRFTDAVEWCALLEATKRGVTIPGLANPSYPAAEAKTTNLRAAPSAPTEIPRFKRFELADRVYQAQFLAPLLARTQDIQERWAAASPDHAGEALSPADRFHHLWEFDKNGILRTLAIAYIELGAKLRDDEEAIKRRHHGMGNFVWMQNDEDGGINPKVVTWGLEGMMEFQERSSLLLSEAVLFANEAYNTQGSLWTVVGGQGGNAPVNMTLEHFLQSFNEQIGDALKELQEHLAHVHGIPTEIKQRLEGNLKQAEAGREAADMELDEAGRDPAKLDAAWAKIAATGDELTKAWAEIINMEETQRKAVEKLHVAGFCRASKYEGRLREMLQRMVDELNKDPMVRRRIELAKKLFPNETKYHWDSKDLMLLTKESLMAGFFDKYVKQLLLIRKGKDAYPDYRSRKLNQATLGEGPFKITGHDAGSNLVNLQLAELARLIKRIRLHKRTVPKQPLTEKTKNAPLTEEEQEALNVWNKAAEAVAEPTPDEKRMKHLLEQLGVAVKIELKENVTEKTRELIDTALNDPNFKSFKDNTERKVAEIIFGAGAEAYQTELETKPGSTPWGVRHLIQHLLWHCALVNQLFRKIRSRGPMDLPVGSFVEEPD